MINEKFSGCVGKGFFFHCILRFRSFSIFSVDDSKKLRNVKSLVAGKTRHI
jgi:hypothetical protein